MGHGAAKDLFDSLFPVLHFSHLAFEPLSCASECLSLMLSYSLFHCPSCFYCLPPPSLSLQTHKPHRPPSFLSGLYLRDDCDQLALKLAHSGPKRKIKETCTFLTYNNSLRKYIERREREPLSPSANRVKKPAGPNINGTKLTHRIINAMQMVVIVFIKERKKERKEKNVSRSNFLISNSHSACLCV